MDLGYIATTMDANAVIISYEVSSYLISSYNLVTMNELTSMSYITMDNISECGYTSALTYSEMETLFPLSEQI